MIHVRVNLDEANAFVSAYHRHHKPVVGHLFSLGACLEDKIVGVVIVGRPVSRLRDDGLTAEVTRLCTDGTRNACSFLYGAAARAAFALGFKRIGTRAKVSMIASSRSWAKYRLTSASQRASTPTHQSINSGDIPPRFAQSHRRWICHSYPASRCEFCHRIS